MKLKRNHGHGDKERKLGSLSSSSSSSLSAGVTQRKGQRRRRGLGHQHSRSGMQHQGQNQEEQDDTNDMQLANQNEQRLERDSNHELSLSLSSLGEEEAEEESEEWQPSFQQIKTKSGRKTKESHCEKSAKIDSDKNSKQETESKEAHAPLGFSFHSEPTSEPASPIVSTKENSRSLSSVASSSSTTLGSSKRRKVLLAAALEEQQKVEKPVKNKVTTKRNKRDGPAWVHGGCTGRKSYGTARRGRSNQGRHNVQKQPQTEKDETNDSNHQLLHDSKKRKEGEVCDEKTGSLSQSAELVAQNKSKAHVTHDEKSKLTATKRNLTKFPSPNEQNEPNSTALKEASISPTPTNTESTVNNNTTTTSNNHEFLLQIHDQMEQMGKALQCRICRSTLHQPCLLPCVHAFCQSCIHTHLSSNYDENHHNHKQRTQGCCPIFYKAHATKRSITRSLHLDEIVKGYKEALRAFGLVPLVYSPTSDVEMTQPRGRGNCRLDEKESFEEEEMEDEDRDGNAVVVKESNADDGTSVKPSLMQCHEHLGSRSLRLRAECDRDPAAITNSSDSPQSENNNQSKHTVNQSKKKDGVDDATWWAVRTQEKVVKADERAFVDAAVRKENNKCKKSSDTSENNAHVQHQKEEEGKRNEADPPCETAPPTTVDKDTKEVGHGNSNETEIESLGDKDNDEINILQDEETFSPPPSLSFTQEEALRDATRDLEAANASFEWEEEQRKMEEEEQKEENHQQKGRNEANTGNKANKKHPSKVEATKNRAASVDASSSGKGRELLQMSTTVDDGVHEEPSHTLPFQKGTIVRVAPRTWPGINKPGGVAKITAFHQDGSTETGIKPSIYYDVSYVLGGREKRVDAMYVRLEDDKDDDFENDSYKSHGEGTKNRTTRSSPRMVSTSPQGKKTGSTGVAPKVDAFSSPCPRRVSLGTSPQGTVRTRSARKKRQRKSSGQSSNAAVTCEDFGTSGEPLKGSHDDESNMFVEYDKAPAKKRGRKATNSVSAEHDKAPAKKRGRKAKNECRKVKGQEDDSCEDQVTGMVDSGAGKGTGKLTTKAKNESQKRKVEPSTTNKENAQTETKEVKRRGKRVLAPCESKANILANNSAQRKNTTDNQLTKKPRKNQTVQEKVSEKKDKQAHVNVDWAQKHYPKHSDKRESEAILMPKELCNMADVYYDKFVQCQLDAEKTIYITSSSVTEYVKNLLDVLVRDMKSYGVTVRIQKDFLPSKTTLCITPPSSIRSPSTVTFGKCGTSEFRTVKTMRASLWGVPIVTPDWIKICLREKQIVSPQGKYCIRTLPSKVDKWMAEGSLPDSTSKDSPGTVESTASARFGVARTAVRVLSQNLSNVAEVSLQPVPLLAGTFVLLCGPWKKELGGPKRADAQVLLRESGATVLPSVGAAVTQLRKLQTPLHDKGEHDANCRKCHVVLLCDNASSEKLPSKLIREVEKIVSSGARNCDGSFPGGRVSVVSSSWLFDCISCSTNVTDIASYEPASEQAKSLWVLCS